ncbi:MAG TPA: glycosyltransferase [Thermoanaerobaculia bacterium]|jgi:glycosyltransferase involved in cell wall biosynthesis|nr:glycosyltransferase [Thermoanaerobaculia bacterium]
MQVSVVIPCRNAAETVPDAIRSALGQAEPPFEVIVVDDVSTDASAEAARAAGARVIRNASRRNAGGARNAGLEATSGELVAFLDADAVAPPDWLSRARAVLDARPEVVGVGGAIANGRPGRWGELDYYMNHSEWIAGTPGAKRNIPTMAIVYRRAAIGPVRFPESNTGEDTAFALAVLERGGTLWYEPSIVVTHRHERLDARAYREKQVACGVTIYETRSRYDRPGRVLVRHPALLWLFPHLWITLWRMARSGHAGRAIALFPWLVQGEIARIHGFHEARRAARSHPAAQPQASGVRDAPVKGARA